MFFAKNTTIAVEQNLLFAHFYIVGKRQKIRITVSPKKKTAE